MPPPKQNLSEQLNQTEKYEAWANREAIIGEHVRNLYDTQKCMSKVVACMTGVKPTTQNAEGLLWEELYTKMYVLLCQVDIKIDKLSEGGAIPGGFRDKGKALFQSIIERLVTPSNDPTHSIKPSELHNAITMAAQTYDFLGYTAAERKITRSKQQSDVAYGVLDRYTGEEIDA